MRPPHEIRRQVIRIRDQNKLAMTVIAERARVSRYDIIACLSMHASESALQKLDAFLDAPKLHLRDKSHSPICYEMENLAREGYREFKLKTAHPATFALWPPQRQKRYYSTITWRMKLLLQQKMLAEHAILVKVPDGANYWLYKERCRIQRLRREAPVRPIDRNPRRLPWPRPIG